MSDSLTICNGILSHDEQDCIERAARLAHEGKSWAANYFRHLAGYSMSEDPTGDRPSHGGFPDA